MGLDERLVARAPDPEGPVRGVGEADMRALVDSFYDRARTDDLLGPVFTAAVADADWPHHLDTLTDFWSSVLLKTGRYGGRPMPKHVMLPGLGDQHFIRWLALFREAAEAVLPSEVAAVAVSRAERVAHGFRLGIRYHRGEQTLDVEPLTAGRP